METSTALIFVKIEYVQIVAKMVMNIKFVMNQ